MIIENQRFRLLLLTGASLTGLWALRQAALYVWGNGQNLSEYGSLAFGLLINMYTGFLAHFLATGHWLPQRGRTGGSASDTVLMSGRGGIQSGIALTIVSVAWLGIYFLADLFIQAAESGLFDPSVLGVSIPENDATRLAAMFTGIIYAATLFPLIAGASFLCGWVANERFSPHAGWIPAILFVLVAFITNYEAEVFSLGRPPSIAMIRMIFRLPEQQLIFADVAVMWLVTLFMAALVAGALCIFFYVWANLGRIFRRIV